MCEFLLYEYWLTMLPTGGGGGGGGGGSGGADGDGRLLGVLDAKGSGNFLLSANLLENLTPVLFPSWRGKTQSLLTDLSNQQTKDHS